ncbi:MAG: hypothetical protein ACRDPT_10465, partial [Streptomycetales bacterium]
MERRSDERGASEDRSATVDVERRSDEQELTPEQEAEAQQAAVAAQVLRPEEGAGARPAPHSHGAPGEQPPDARPARLASYDVDDFVVPGGREEEWRFTPLKRLRGLATADGSAPHGVSPKHEYGQLPAGVTVS